MAKLTSRTLKRAGACQEQIELFKSLGGDTKNITAALCKKHASQFDWRWAAEHLLSPENLVGYQRVQSPAWAEYERVTALAWAEYQRVEAVIFWELYSAQ